MSARDAGDLIGPERYSEHTRLPGVGQIEGMEVRDRDGRRIVTTTAPTCARVSRLLGVSHPPVARG